MRLDEYRKKLTAFREACTLAIGDSNIKICVENTRSFELGFDTGHNAGGGFMQFPLIEKQLGRLSHMHLHDYRKTGGDHLPLGEGNLNILEYLKLASEHRCRVLLETKTAEGLRISVGWLKKNFDFAEGIS